MIQIEKNIPLPTRIRASSAAFPWRDMEIGDSFFVPCVKEELQKLRNRISALGGHKNDRKFAQRKVDGGLRVWRIQTKVA